MTRKTPEELARAIAGFASNHGWPDETVGKLKQHLADYDLEAALLLIEEHDMPGTSGIMLKSFVLAQWLEAVS